MRPLRSMLFVPGHKEGWPEKAVAAGSEVVLLVLEDAVPVSFKAEAEGRAAVVYEGQHIDYAHVKTAKQVIELHRTLSGLSA